jgi:predicted carbohydrate-binding protein with CBM5 and CBM33 domain
MTSTKRTTGLASLSLAVLLTLLMGTPAMAHGNDVQPVSRRATVVLAADTQAATATAAPTPTPAKNIYAARESKDLEKFRGGDVVIIGSTTVLVVLLVVLLIVVVS